MEVFFTLIYKTANRLHHWYHFR